MFHLYSWYLFTVECDTKKRLAAAPKCFFSPECCMQSNAIQIDFNYF